MNVNATVPFSGSLDEVVVHSSRVSVQYTVGKCYGSNCARAHMKWAAAYSMDIHPLCDTVDVGVGKLVRWSLLTSPKWENKKTKTTSQ